MTSPGQSHDIRFQRFPGLGQMVVGTLVALAWAGLWIASGFAWHRVIGVVFGLLVISQGVLARRRAKRVTEEFEARIALSIDERP